LKRAVFMGLCAGIVVFIIGYLIPESNYKKFIISFVVGLCVLFAGLINIKHKSK
jgi:uncharacterized membrane protein YjjP (DUF1212 family)